MAKNQNKYIGKELDWLEEQWKNLQKYVDANPIQDMSDRVISIQAGKAMIDKVTATIEQQITSVRNTLKEMPEILSAIATLREKNDKKDVSVRGAGSVPHMMRQ